VGCQVYCDRQYISFSDLEQVVLKLKLECKQAKDLQTKRQEDRKRKEEALASGDPERRKNEEILEYMQANTQRPGETRVSDDELAEMVKALAKWEGLEIKELVAKCEIVFID
jgi:hypothetical protein